MQLLLLHAYRVLLFNCALLQLGSSAMTVERYADKAPMVVAFILSDKRSIILNLYGRKLKKALTVISLKGCGTVSLPLMTVTLNPRNGTGNVTVQQPMPLQLPPCDAMCIAAMEEHLLVQ